MTIAVDWDVKPQTKLYFSNTGNRCLENFNPLQLWLVVDSRIPILCLSGSNMFFFMHLGSLGPKEDFFKS